MLRIFGPGVGIVWCHASGGRDHPEKNSHHAKGPEGKSRHERQETSERGARLWVSVV